MDIRHDTSVSQSRLEYSLSARGNQSALLMSLHTARRLLITQIAAATLAGTSTFALECDLGNNRAATRYFLADEGPA